MKKLIFLRNLLFLAVFLFTCLTPLSRIQSAKSKVSLSLLEMTRSVAPVSLMVQFNTPTLSEWKTASSFGSATIDPLIYETTNQSIQLQFVRWLEKKDFTLSDVHSVSKLMNALQLTAPGYAIPIIASYHSVQSISLAHVPWETSRSFVRSAWFDENEIPPKQDYPYTGKGVKVGIIDTGLDIGDEFRGKDIQGVNFASPEENWRDIGFHGTAIAGIIGGNGDEWYKKGVAPEVSFRIYKVFAKNDYRPLGIIQAIEKAVEDRCEIINLSLNGLDNPLFDGEEKLVETALSEARKAGVIAVVPTGNLSTIQKPGTFPDTMTVGSADDRSLFMVKAKWKEVDYSIKGYSGYLSLPFSLELNQVPLVYAGYGRINDFDQVMVKDKIVLIDRGPMKEPITFYEKVTRATEQGAKAVLLVNDEPGLPINPYVNLDYKAAYPGEPRLFENPYNATSERYRYKPYHQMIPSGMISYEDGRWLKAHHQEIQLTFSDSPFVSLGEYLSTGSPNSDSIKPDFVAPGEMIIAPYQKKNEDNRSYYLAMNGSSASTAFASGAVALLKESHPEWNNQQITTTLQNTAQLVRNPFSLLPYGMFYQGAGLIQPDRAIKAKIRLEPVLTSYSAGVESHPHLQLTNLTQEELRLPVKVECSRDVFEWTALIQKQLPEIMILRPGEKMDLNITIPKSVQSTLDFWVHIGESHSGIHIQGKEDEKQKRPITNFTVSQNKLKSPLDNMITLQYTLQECTIFGSATRNYHWNTGWTSIRLLNQYKSLVAVISNDLKAMLGENIFYWDGKVSDTPLHISKGTYFFELTLYRFQETPQQANKKIISDQVFIEFQVTESEGASNYLCLACNQKTDVNDPMELTINFTRSVILQKIDLEISFNPRLLLYEEIHLAPPWENNRDIVIETQGSNAKGWLIIRIFAKTGKTIPISAFQPLLIIQMIPDQPGISQILVNQRRLLGPNEKEISVFAIPSTVEILNTPFLLADFNFDNRVDANDQEIWLQGYGNTIGQADYTKILDINQNGRIGPEELMWMAKEWEQEIIP